jgi:membrane protein DedA with SNARE-associated domain
MNYRRYTGFNLISSAVWCGGLLGFGFYLGSFPLVSGLIDLLTDLFVLILAIAILITLVMTERDYVRRNTG